MNTKKRATAVEAIDTNTHVRLHSNANVSLFPPSCLPSTLARRDPFLAVRSSELAEHSFSMAKN